MPSPLSAPAFVCDCCPDCCRSVRVPITHRDLERLESATTTAVANLVEWLSPEDIDMSGEPESFVEARPGRRLLVLRHVDLGCALLSATGRCTRYDSRPAACVAYPFTLSGATIELLPDAPCRAPVHVDPALSAAAVARVESELAEYVALVGHWNRRQRQRRQLHKALEIHDQFLEFLRARAEAHGNPREPPKRHPG